jgi:O-acetyl-ADP-ribose deacetylase (regulator of RNase III)
LERIEIIKGDVTLLNQDLICQQDHLNEDQKIADYYTNELSQAVENGIKTIAFYCTAPDEQDFSVERWAQITYHTIEHFLSSNSSLEKVTLVCFSDDIFNCYKKLAKLTQGEEFRAIMEAKLKAGEHHTWMIKDFNRLKQNGE